tara:strand:+ start:153 stop:554 length:402 start_codon:yes stop_codon:yes gene_type:complete
MALVCPDQKGEILLLQYIVGMVNADNPVLHLYANDITPSDSTVIGNLTEVAGATGYAAITLLSAQWTTTQSGGITTAVYSEQTFTFTTDATSFGYYITDESANLLWLERFSGAPFDIPDGGGTISITTKLTLS